MSHHCKNLLIRCMDFRLNENFYRWINESDFSDGGMDIISLAGSSKLLADGSQEIKDTFLNNVGVSTELHHAKNIIICHHSDCGAYAKSYKFNSPEEEKEKQIEDMEKSKTLINKKYPNAKVILVWAELKDSEGKEINFEIINN